MDTDVGSGVTSELSKREVDQSEDGSHHKNGDHEQNESSSSDKPEESHYSTEDPEERTVANGIRNLDLEGSNETSEPSDKATGGDEKPKGERILIERDGKFELVDATAVKAEFFDMLGLDMSNHSEHEEHTEEEKPADSSEESQETSGVEADSNKIERPHTSPTRSNKNTLAAKPNNARSQSAAVKTRSNREYNGTRSRYGMTEQQLEMKKKREDALMRRRREEDERRKEEVNRKRQDAERAFQAWLQSKNSEALERRKALSKNQKKDDSKEKEESANRAYQAWLDEKAKQLKQEKYVEKCRLQEEASSYVIRDRNLCEAAFQSWLRKKRTESNRTGKRSRKKKSHGRSLQSSKSTTRKLKDYYGPRSALSV